jgi:hypothetical protein
MGSLNNDTLTTIQETAIKSSGAAGKAVVLEIPGQPAHKKAIIDAAGKLTWIDLEPICRQHTIVTLDECIEFINSKGGETTVVWFDRTGVVVVLDDNTRRDIATMKFTLTPEIVKLAEIEKSKQRFNQRDFRRLLRIDLGNCRMDDVLLNWVSSVKFNTSASQGGVIKQGKESLGSDIDDAAISDLGECPEEIGLQVRVFDDHRLKDKCGVKCAVEVFLREAEFTLTPMPLEIHTAIEMELDVVAEKLRSGVKVPAFRGRP